MRISGVLAPNSGGSCHFPTTLVVLSRHERVHSIVLRPCGREKKHFLALERATWGEKVMFSGAARAQGMKG